MSVDSARKEKAVAHWQHRIDYWLKKVEQAEAAHDEGRVIHACMRLEVAGRALKRAADREKRAFEEEQLRHQG